MIQARMEKTLGSLVQVIVSTRDDHKLGQLEEELLRAIHKIREERFKLRQANFLKARGG